MIPFSDIYFIMKISMVFGIWTKMLHKQAGTWLELDWIIYAGNIKFEARISCTLKKKLYYMPIILHFLIKF